MSTYQHPTRIFKTANELLEAWNEYKSDRDLEGKKWAKIQYVGKEGQRVEDYPPMPYDLDNFCTWYKNKYDKFIHQYFKETQNYEPEFLPIVTHILSERNSNIKTGTLLGHYNSAIGIRIVGLAENVKQEQNININKMPEWIKAPIEDSNLNKTDS